MEESLTHHVEKKTHFYYFWKRNHYSHNQDELLSALQRFMEVIGLESGAEVLLIQLKQCSSVDSCTLPDQLGYHLIWNRTEYRETRFKNEFAKQLHSLLTLDQYLPLSSSSIEMELKSSLFRHWVMLYILKGRFNNIHKNWVIKGLPNLERRSEAVRWTIDALNSEIMMNMLQIQALWGYDRSKLIDESIEWIRGFGVDDELVLSLTNSRTMDSLMMETFEWMMLKDAFESMYW